MSEVKEFNEIQELASVIQNLRATVNTLAPVEVKTKTEKDFSKAVDILTKMSLKLPKTWVVSVIEKNDERDIEEEKDFYTTGEMSKIFGVTVQAVHRWIQENKIDFIPIYSPGASKKVSEYRIPKTQFELSENPVIQRLNELRKIQELKKKMNWNTVEKEDVFPIEEDEMEGLDC